MENTVSILIVSKNVERYISSCLSSILAQSHQNFEVIIVDDSSSDATKDIVLAFNDERIHFYTNKKLLGRTASRNKSVSLAKGKYLFFTDADCRVHNKWVEEGLKFFENPNIVGVEGKTIYVSEDYKPTRSDDIVENYCGGHFMTCNMAYKRGAIEKAGGFDERLTHFEDRDIAFRVIRQGPILFNDRMIVYHQSKSMNPEQFLRTASILSNRVYLYKRFGSDPLICWRIAQPVELAKLIFPPIIFGSLFLGKYKSKKDFDIFPYIYPKTLKERLLFWKTCAKEKVLLL
ncbi:MAG TPA: glycosyltransferase family A protein [Candidatus Nanoarchaeia archaeon]|nr:glycosyltransferase family A protein [Candidatus Nanoarchaeia archaeon]